MSTIQADDKMGSGEESVVDRTSRNEDDQVPGLELTPARARRLVLKTDLVIMPLAVLSMTLAFLDKVSFLCHSKKQNDKPRAHETDTPEISPERPRIRSSTRYQDRRPFTRPAI